MLLRHIKQMKSRHKHDLLTNFENVLNEYHIYVMKNDSIKKIFVIQKTHKNFHFVHFFFDNFFQIDDF